MKLFFLYKIKHLGQNIYQFDVEQLKETALLDPDCGTSTPINYDVDVSAFDRELYYCPSSPINSLIRGIHSWILLSFKGNICRQNFTQPNNHIKVQWFQEDDFRGMITYTTEQLPDVVFYTQQKLITYLEPRINFRPDNYVERITSRDKTDELCLNHQEKLQLWIYQNHHILKHYQEFIDSQIVIKPEFDGKSVVELLSYKEILDDILNMFEKDIYYYVLGFYQSEDVDRLIYALYNINIETLKQLHVGYCVDYLIRCFGPEKISCPHYLRKIVTDVLQSIGFYISTNDRFVDKVVENLKRKGVIKS